MSESGVGRCPQYDGRAVEYARAVEHNPLNAEIEYPAFLELVGGVAGRQVLDLGCGSGRYTEELFRRGARVVGLDQSPDNIELARQRVPEANFRVHDLADPLDWLASGSFSVAVMGMTFHYLDDRVGALREVHRVLEPEGVLVLSTRHPTDWLRSYGGGYFDEGVVEDEWENGWRLRWWRQPLERTMEVFSMAGFRVDRLVEPRPAEELATRAPEAYTLAMTNPIFIAFRLAKRS